MGEGAKEERAEHLRPLNPVRLLVTCNRCDCNSCNGSGCSRLGPVTPSSCTMSAACSFHCHSRLNTVPSLTSVQD